MQDDAVMSARATHVLDEILSEDVPGFVSVVAVAEIVWILRTTYRIGKEGIASAIESLLESKTLVIEREREVFLAW
jgi:predicted nucleic-acid-binding protein